MNGRSAVVAVHQHSGLDLWQPAVGVDQPPPPRAVGALTATRGSEGPDLDRGRLLPALQGEGWRPREVDDAISLLTELGAVRTRGPLVARPAP